MFKFILKIKLVRRFLALSARSRFKWLSTLSLNIIRPKGKLFVAPKNAITFLAGGDVSFDLKIRTIPYVGGLLSGLTPTKI